MYSKNVDHSSLISDLTRYINRRHLPVINYPILDDLIENPDMQFLLSIWLKKNSKGQFNDGQLFYLLAYKVDQLNRLEKAEQERELNKLFEYAHALSSLIPVMSNLDRVVDSMGKLNHEIIDGWSDFNLPLGELDQDDIKKLQHLAFYINGGLFNANLAVGMTQSQIQTFDQRVEEIIKNHADYITVTRKQESYDQSKLVRIENSVIYSDKLIELLKQDIIIKEILFGAKAFKPIPVPPITTESSEDLLDKYLGFEEDDVSIPTARDLSSITADSSDEILWKDDRSLAQKNEPSSVEDIQDLSSVTTNESADSVGKNKASNRLQTQQIPGSASAGDETDYNRLVSRLKQKFMPPSFRDISQNEPEKAPSLLTRYSGKTGNSVDRSSKTENSIGREPFIPVIKDNTFNKNLKERNRHQRRHNYLGFEPAEDKQAPKRQSQTYKERMRNEQSTDSSMTDAPQDSSKSKSHLSKPN